MRFTQLGRVPAPDLEAAQRADVDQADIGPHGADLGRDRARALPRRRGRPGRYHRPAGIIPRPARDGGDASAVSRAGSKPRPARRRSSRAGRAAAGSVVPTAAGRCRRRGTMRSAFRRRVPALARAHAARGVALDELESSKPSATAFTRSWTVWSSSKSTKSLPLRCGKIGQGWLTAAFHRRGSQERRAAPPPRPSTATAAGRHRPPTAWRSPSVTYSTRRARLAVGEVARRRASCPTAHRRRGRRRVQSARRPSAPTPAR